jgi:hypothetical protein
VSLKIIIAAEFSPHISTPHTHIRHITGAYVSSHNLPRASKHSQQSNRKIITNSATSNNFIKVS